MKTRTKLALAGFIILIVIAFFGCSSDEYAKCTNYQPGYGTNTPAKFYKNHK